MYLRVIHSRQRLPSNVQASLMFHQVVSYSVDHGLIKLPRRPFLLEWYPVVFRRFGLERSKQLMELTNKLGPIICQHMFKTSLQDWPVVHKKWRTLQIILPRHHFSSCWDLVGIPHYQHKLLSFRLMSWTVVPICPLLRISIGHSPKKEEGIAHISPTTCFGRIHYNISQLLTLQWSGAARSIPFASCRTYIIRHRHQTMWSNETDIAGMLIKRRNVICIEIPIGTVRVKNPYLS